MVDAVGLSQPSGVPQDRFRLVAQTAGERITLMQKLQRTWLLVVAVAFVALFTMPLWGGGMMGRGIFGAAQGWGWLGLLGMGLGMVVFWGALIGGVVLLARLLSGQTADHAGAGTDSAQEVLKRRFAAGEMSQADYERMSAVLEGQAPSGPHARPA